MLSMYKNLIITIYSLMLLISTHTITKETKADIISANSSDLTNPVLQIIPLDMLRVRKIAAMLPEAPHGFGETYHNRSVWDKLYHDPNYLKVIKTAEDLLNKPFPSWSDEQYLVYFNIGTRREGERMLRDRFRWLAPLVWAECMENTGRFVPTIEMVINELIHQKSWTLPAHDNNKQNFEGLNYTVDLNVAVFGHNIAQAFYLLDDKLNSSLRADILRQLYKRMFNPVLKTIETKNDDHWWLTITSNWNSVCLSGVTGAALAIIPQKEERAKFVTIAERYSKNSVAGFTNDGYCTEGLGYYSYGFGNYIILRENILQATNNEIDLFADPKIKRIAAYATNLEIMNNVYPNIADCRLSEKAPADVLWYCGRNLGLDLKEYDNLTFEGATRNLVEDVMHTFPNSASKSNISINNPQLARDIRSYFKDAGVLIVRPSLGSNCYIGAALKGGNNNEIHNHNDVGSYSVVVGDELLMGDPGGPYTYTSKTFGTDRYTIKPLASYGHPVPLLAGKEQSTGGQAHAKILEAQFSQQEDKFVIDIASAYDVPCLKLKRSFIYDREGEGKLVVTDEFSFNKEETFETALITRATCTQIGKKQLEFSGKRYKMIATIDAPGEFDITYETIQEDEPEFTRVAIRLKNPLQSGEINICFIPVKI
jgi:hypothetical protein